MYISIDNTLGGIITVADTVKDNSKKAIEKLMQYRKGKNQNDKKVIAAINRMLESDCEDFLLTFYNSISFYDLTLDKRNISMYYIDITTRTKGRYK